MRSFALDRHVERALDGHEHSLERQAAFVGDRDPVRALGDLRIDDRRDVLLVPRLEDEQPLEHAHLRRGQADAVGVAHQVRHLVRETRQVVVELLDLVGAHPQHRVRVLANLREGDTTARFLLRVELSLVPLVAAVYLFRGPPPSDAMTRV